MFNRGEDSGPSGAVGLWRFFGRILQRPKDGSLTRMSPGTQRLCWVLLLFGGLLAILWVKSCSA